PYRGSHDHPSPILRAAASTTYCTCQLPYPNRSTVLVTRPCYLVSSANESWMVMGFSLLAIETAEAPSGRYSYPLLPMGSSPSVTVYVWCWPEEWTTLTRTRAPGFAGARAVISAMFPAIGVALSCTITSPGVRPACCAGPCAARPVTRTPLLTGKP